MVLLSAGHTGPITELVTVGTGMEVVRVGKREV
jgi:hypothetical protein